MCGRFYIPEPDDTPEELAVLLKEAQAREEKRVPGFLLKRGQICPGDSAAVLAPDRKRQTRAFVMRWGFQLPSKADSGLNRKTSPSSGISPHGHLVFNARSETAAQRPLFSDSLSQRRCLIPCTYYFEWDHRAKPYEKYRFHPEGQRLTWLCGLYRITDSGPEFTILTRDAASCISCFHDRMPVMLPGSGASAWLDESIAPSFLLTQALQDISYSR